MKELSLNPPYLTTTYVCMYIYIYIYMAQLYEKNKCVTCFTCVVVFCFRGVCFVVCRVTFLQQTWVLTGWLWGISLPCLLLFLVLLAFLRFFFSFLQLLSFFLSLFIYFFLSCFFLPSFLLSFLLSFFLSFFLLFFLCFKVFLRASLLLGERFVCTGLSRAEG